MRPFNGNTQPKVARTPTARPHKNVVSVGAQKAAVDAFNFFGHAIVVGSREVVAVLNVHHVGNVVGNAMPQRVVRTQQALCVGYGRQVLVKYLFGIYDGAYLQKVELARTVGVDVTGKLNFHRAFHGILAIAHGHLHDLR